MTDVPDPLPLAAEFPPATPDQWRKLVDAVLKGASFERKLVARTHDGLTIQPLYARDARAQPLAGRVPGAWQILQRVDHPDPAAANAEARHDRDNGATGLSFVLAGAIGAYGYGLAARNDAIARAFDGIRLDASDLAIELDLGGHHDAGRAVANLMQAGGIPPAAAAVRFGFDPLGAIAASAGGTQDWSAIAPPFAGLVGELAAEGFKGPFAVADGRVIHNAGGSLAQELGYVLAVAVAYLRALEAAGIALEQARRMVFFRLAADADQFPTIAKFHALRRLWARVEAACGLTPAAAFISAETAWRMMTQRDPHVNILRATIAVFAAGVGGADAVSVLPFTQARGLPDRFARRVARNTQLILLEESNLAKIADAAAGAGGIGDLTEQLCQQAWTLFREIEQAGGAAAALEQGLVQQQVAAVRRAREAAIAKRTDALTGTSDFPDLGEAPVAVLDVAPAQTSPVAETLVSLPRVRLAEPFERLRDASDRMLAQSGARPTIFLANLGTPAEFTARATFAKSFFEAGGIAAITNDGFALASAAAADVTTDLAALAAAFKNSGAVLACLCTSDDVYAREAEAAAQALTLAGARHLHLAGRPGPRESELRGAGIETFVYLGCDALAVLRATQEQIASPALT